MSIAARIAHTVKSSRVAVVRETASSWIGRLQIIREFAVDARDYMKSSAYRPMSRRSSEQLQRDLTFSYHQVEKALAFPQPRRPFGAKAQEGMADVLSFFGASGVDLEPTVLESARNANLALRQWNHGGEILDDVAPVASEMAGFSVTEDFFQSRHSCRNFDASRIVTDEEVRRIVELAQTAPSVCNRQAGRVHVLRSPEVIQGALALQNGNRGFGETIQHLAVFTVDRRAFKDALERNQRWVDGALFAMTFVWALHSRALSSCMLNWSMGVTATRKLRKLLELSEHEDVICMVAFGYQAPGARVANSARYQLGYVLTEH